MDSIVEQIAKEVMVKLKSDSANRGSSYSPLPIKNEGQKSSGNTALLLTANFKVIDQVLAQIDNISSSNTRVIVSTYLQQNYISKGYKMTGNVCHYNNTSPKEALENIGTLLIPSLSINSLSKAANLIADSFVTIVLCQALSCGIKIIVTDESIIDSSRYFPAGVALKIDNLRRELETMGVVFQRNYSIKVAAEHKCSTCVAGGCDTCNKSCSTTANVSVNSKFADKPIRGNANNFSMTEQCHEENCSKTYGSCASNCSSKVKQVLEAGATRIEKGLSAPAPNEDIASYIDHTALKPGTTREEIIKLCEEAKKYGFASVCVNPANVAIASNLLRSSRVKVCTVVGFPLGATSTFTKAMETRDAIANGATEIDMVINVGALKSKDYELVKNDIARVVESASGNTVKVILETSLLTNEEKIKACELSKLAGADFVKTSTGFSTGGATVEDIKLMRETVGPSMGVKASGGIRDTATAMQMINQGATRIGASASVGIVKGEKQSGSGY